MRAPFSEVLEKDNFETALLIGSDIPFLHPEIIEEAFLKLVAADLVLGPALDGGYYLIGLRRRALNQVNIFQDIPWSTNQVLKTTVARARTAGLSVADLAPLLDVDTLSDLKKWSQQETNPAIAAQLNEILLAQQNNFTVDY